MELFEDLEVHSDEETFDPNTLNRKVRISALIDVDRLHEGESLKSEAMELLRELKSRTQESK